MTSSKTTTFDETAYRLDLERAGLSPEDAAGLAAKTARIRNDALADAVEALVAANEDYEVTVEEARETLGIEVHE